MPDYVDFDISCISVRQHHTAYLCRHMDDSADSASWPTSQQQEQRLLTKAHQSTTRPPCQPPVPSSFDTKRLPNDQGARRVDSGISDLSLRLSELVQRKTHTMRDGLIEGHPRPSRAPAHGGGTTRRILRELCQLSIPNNQTQQAQTCSQIVRALPYRYSSRSELFTAGLNF